VSTPNPTRGLLEQTLRSAEQRWSRLNAREQKLVSIAIVVVMFSVLWLILLEPAIKTISAVEKNLPLALKQASRALSLATDIENIKGSTGKAIVQAGGARASIDRTLAERGWSDKTEIKNNESGTLNISVKSVGAKDAFAWLDDIAKQPGVRLDRVRLNKTSPGVVDIVLDITLADKATP
jgi:type II secretory pathway component PulM